MERDITHRCGHIERRFLAGYWNGDRDREATRLERLKCTTCAAEARRAAYVANAATAREQLGDVRLPPLTGTPRQVAWADGIRLEQLAALRQDAPAAVDPALAIVDARWWIERRSASATSLAAAVADLPGIASPR
jgi:hypothetical protein